MVHEARFLNIYFSLFYFSLNDPKMFLFLSILASWWLRLDCNPSYHQGPLFGHLGTESDLVFSGSYFFLSTRRVRPFRQGSDDEHGEELTLPDKSGIFPL